MSTEGNRSHTFLSHTFIATIVAWFSVVVLAFGIFLWLFLSCRCCLGCFLSDPTPIIGNPCHSLTLVTEWRLVDAIDVTLACEDANLKHVEVVTVANIDDEDYGGNRFESWGLVIKLNFCSDFEHFSQDCLKLKFRRDFEAEVWSAFCRWCFEEVTKLNLGQYSEARFGQEFNFRLSWDADVWLKFWSWCLIDIL